MKNNANQTTSTIYYRPLKQWIDVTPEQKRDWERFVGTTRKAKQRAGACCIPYKKSYKCDGICDTCEFRCIPKDAPQHLSIDTEMENAYENGVSRTSFLADSRLTTEIDIDSLILNGLLTELQSPGGPVAGRGDLPRLSRQEARPGRLCLPRRRVPGQSEKEPRAGTGVLRGDPGRGV